MADIKWIKLATNMHEDEKMRLIDAMPERDIIHYVWIRILLLGGKVNANGEIFLSDGMPLTAKMLAVLFSRPLESIKLALKILSRLGMIEIAPDKVIRIVNWDKHQNIEGMERVREQNRKRAETHREKKKLDKKAAKSNNEEIYYDDAVKENGGLEDNDDLSQNKTIDENEALENLEAINDEKTDTVINAMSISNIVETADNNCNVAKNTCNVVESMSNVTVTVQNKKEIENKKKSKKEKKEIESKNKNSCYVNNKSSTCGEDISKSSTLRDKNYENKLLGEEEIDAKTLELMHYHEKKTGVVGGKNYGNLREAVDIHGEKWVKMAMDIAFKKNCPDIEYAFGVLKNWRRDGYPKDDMEVKKNGFRGTGKNNEADKNEFTGFKPKEPRRLTEEQRRSAEENLI
ncbi:phage replisome organizer [Clostridium chromiireducens]|uniref:Phage replisome organizer n=1 Tax=Clostridium chromiireducens TaxID=225345 RepID=A0A964RRZ1_9CLOT|nr:phage replisome organizer N-terminal domain-containing protein [Clostridium chromiireducens]MVX66824.1 phage replisome organizer [Clostridium chromiireducens]